MSLSLASGLVCANDVCKLAPNSATQVTKLKGIPGFFFKVHPEGKYLTYINTGANTLLDLETGDEKRTGGSIDPVWSPDGKIFTHPHGGQNDKEKQVMRFYLGEEILKKTLDGTFNEAKTFDLPLEGVYQSIGKSKDEYSIITDEQGVSLSRFKLTDQGPELVGEFKRPCSNMPTIGVDLPMLSKDGRFLSGYDATSKSTKIYKLNGDECSLAVDLGFPTGKVSFNGDSSQIAFHVDQFAKFDSGYFSGVSKSKVRNVVVLNLSENQDGSLLSPTGWALASHSMKPGNGGYYPDFDKNGNIYFMEDIENQFQIVKTKTADLEFRSMSSMSSDCENCEAPKESKALSAISKLWSSVCASQTGDLKMEAAPILATAIDPVLCLKMIDQFYVPSLEVSVKDLKESCSKNTSRTPVQVGAWDPGRITKAEEIIQSKCIMCHTKQMKYDKEITLITRTGLQTQTDEEIKVKGTFPPLKVTTLDPKSANLMMAAVYKGTMPKGFPLDDAEKELLLPYLQKRIMDASGDDGDNNPDFLVINRFDDAALKSTYETTVGNVLDPVFRQSVQVTVDCVYGNRNCDEYIDLVTPVIAAEAQTKPEAERESFVKNKWLEIRCQNLIGVDAQTCYDWKNQAKK